MRNIKLYLTEEEAEYLIAIRALDGIETRLRRQLEQAQLDRERDAERKANLRPHEFICPKCGGIAERNRLGTGNDYCSLCGPV